VDVLADSPYADGKALGGRLNLIRELPFARLVFDPNSGQRVALRADDGLTIISLQSLDLPANSNRDEYTLQNRLAVGIMYLLTNYTESLMNASDKSHPKAVVIDEAWAITSTPQGKNMIPRLARMGRSLNTALVLVSQNAGDFLDLTNNMSYRMAFRAKDTKEIENVIDFFNLEHNDGNADTISKLLNGECIMKDPEGNISRVYIDSWDKTSRTKFDTNPVTRGKKQ
jgi:DNA helicase HerA-like ATPase